MSNPGMTSFLTEAFSFMDSADFGYRAKNHERICQGFYKMTYPRVSRSQIRLQTGELSCVLCCLR